MDLSSVLLKTNCYRYNVLKRGTSVHNLIYIHFFLEQLATNCGRIIKCGVSLSCVIDRVLRLRNDL